LNYRDVFGALDWTRTSKLLNSHNDLNVACLPIPPQGLLNMLMKNHYLLNYNDSFISKHIDLTNDKPDIWETVKVNTINSLTKNGLQFLLQTGLRPFSKFNLFIGPPDFDSAIHIDSLSQSYAINYIWGDSESKMRWFDIISNEPHNPGVTTAGTNYMKYNDTQVKLIEEINVPKNTLILVRTDVPHQVINCSNSKRYCLSLRGSPVLKWENAVEHFRPYFLEES